MGKLVSDQLSSNRALGLKLISPEKDVLADGESLGIQACALMRGGIAGVNTDIREIRAEPRLHMTANRGRQRRTAGKVHARSRLRTRRGLSGRGGFGAVHRAFLSALLSSGRGCRRQVHAGNLAGCFFGLELG